MRAPEAAAGLLAELVGHRPPLQLVVKRGRVDGGWPPGDVGLWLLAPGEGRRGARAAMASAGGGGGGVGYQPTTRRSPAQPTAASGDCKRWGRPRHGD